MAQAGIQDSVCDCRLDVAEQQLRFRRLPITPGASDFLVERLGRSGGDHVDNLADRWLVDPHAERLGCDQYAKALPGSADEVALQRSFDIRPWPRPGSRARPNGNRPLDISLGELIPAPALVIDRLIFRSEAHTAELQSLNR